MKYMKMKKIKKIVIITILLFYAIIGLVPMYWMTVNAFMPSEITLRIPPRWFPIEVTFANFKQLFNKMPAVRWILNSLFVAITITCTVIFIAPLAGYAFAKMDFPGKNILFWLVVASFLVPTQLVVIYLYIMVQKIGWINTYFALIIPPLGHATGLFLMKQYIQTLPTSILEAGRIDGCSEFGLFWHIIYPLSKPGIAVLAITQFVMHWNGFFWPLISTNSLKMRLIQVGLAIYRWTWQTQFSSQMAGALLAAIPVVIVFLSLQKYFIEGLTVGAIK